MDGVAKSPPPSLSSSWFGVKPEPKSWQFGKWKQLRGTGTSSSVIKMRDRSKNRKPLQRGRNLSIEAIQAIQSLKRANRNTNSLEQVFDSKFRRLLKFDMMAVLRELLRQNHCLLALKVFEDIRQEDWYRPQVSLYADMIRVFAENDLFDYVQVVYLYLKSENNCLEPEIEGFNALLTSLISSNLKGLVMDCYELMKSVGCEPDRSSFRILINGLEPIGEEGSLAVIRNDAVKYYGDLEFLEEEEEEETPASRKPFSMMN